MALLVDMKLPKPKKSNQDNCPATIGCGAGEEYPYGLKLSFNPSELKKMPGLLDLDVDTAVHISATGTVVMKRQEKMQGGVDDSRIEIQIEKICVESPDSEDSFEFMTKERYKGKR